MPALSGWVATIASFLSFALVGALFRLLPEGASFHQEAAGWISVSDLQLPLSLHFDALTAIMCLVITGVGSFIHLYSIDYMADDPSRPRFFSYLNLFLFAMLVLVLGASLPILFIGWEGVGLCSYLLIGFWHENESYADAGKKAFIVNRIGDVGFLIAMFLLFINFHTLNFAELNAMLTPAAKFTVGSAYLIGLALFIGAVGKSAQIPLFVWLPDAMAGPTPVSALIHAATMVTAGIYLLCRIHPLLELSPDLMMLITVIALATALMAALIALTQNDIKKVLAYSTVSQLGFMFMAVGVGAYWIAIFHLITHAFFKACLFLGAGSVIHACHHEQDMRRMGGLLKPMRLTALTYGISMLAIAGIAPFSGYYSKHAILESIAETDHSIFFPYAWLIGNLASFTGFLTSFYMARSFAMTFLGSYRGSGHPHESPWKMTVPLLVLALLAAVSGLWIEGVLPEYLHSVLGAGDHPYGEGIFMNVVHSWVGICGVLAATLFYTIWVDLPTRCAQLFKPLTVLSENKFYVDEMYDYFIVRSLRGFSQFLSQRIDQLSIDFAVNATGKSVDATGFIVSRLQSGQIRSYAALMALGALFLLLFYVVL